MALRIVTLEEAPELEPLLWDESLRSTWPEFMHHGASSSYFFADGVLARRHGYMLAAYDDAEPGRLVARAFSTPVALSGEGREDLPDGGWDAIVRWAHADLLDDRATDSVSALEILIRADQRGAGLSYAMLEAMRANAKRRGATRLVAPVRPNGKHREPQMPMQEYAFRSREDGLPHDDWLRVHVRAGGRIVKVAPVSFCVNGSLTQWRRWTGLPFDRDGAQEVPFALNPVMASLAQDHAVYAEPNVWVEHRVA